jgi:hypothetical protein
VKPSDAPWAGRRCIVVGGDAIAIATVRALVDGGGEVHWVAPTEPAERVRAIASLTVLGDDEPLSRAVTRIGSVVDAVFDLRRAPWAPRIAEVGELVPPLMVLGGTIVLLVGDTPGDHPGLSGPDGVPIRVVAVPAGPHGHDSDVLGVSDALVCAGLAAGQETGVGSRKEIP